MKINKWKVEFFVAIIFLIVSCKNRYNEMISWSDNIAKGTSIDSVKKITPIFIEVDWNNPENYDDETRYYITNIKGTDDFLNMSNYLSFKENKYIGRFAQK